MINIFPVPMETEDWTRLKSIQCTRKQIIKATEAWSEILKSAIVKH